MEAPDKIYIPSILTANSVRFKEEGSIEYIRADVFIEKACEFIRERLVFEDKLWHKDNEPTIMDKVVEDFKNYVKD